ncbi:hypothetical protein EGY31_10160 [Burkholderia multivorans]|nr:hypothetical protein EGY31_10160 [Burkholderia multivorans]
MPAPCVDLSHVLPYETTYFDDRLAVNRNDLDISSLLGVYGDVGAVAWRAKTGPFVSRKSNSSLASSSRANATITAKHMPCSHRPASRHHRRKERYLTWGASIAQRASCASYRWPTARRVVAGKRSCTSG